MQKIYLFWYQSLGTWQFLHTMEVSCSSMIFISTCTIQIILLKCSFCYLIIGELEEISAWHIYNTFTPRLVTERKEGPVLCLRTDAKSSQLTKQSRVRSWPKKLDSREKVEPILKSQSKRPPIAPQPSMTGRHTLQRYGYTEFPGFKFRPNILRAEHNGGQEDRFKCLFSINFSIKDDWSKSKWMWDCNMPTGNFH